MLYLKAFVNLTSVGAVGRCASDLLIYIGFLIFQMTAIKEALTRFYGVTPKIQCLPPEEVKTPNKHMFPKPPKTEKQMKSQTNKQFFFFFKERFLSKNKSKNRMKNLQHGET